MLFHCTDQNLQMQLDQQGLLAWIKFSHVTTLQTANFLAGFIFLLMVIDKET